MTIAPLIPLLEKYFAAATHNDHDMLADCFAERSVVVDDGHLYLGRDAIRRWSQDEATTFTYTSELTASESIGRTGHHITMHLEGNFPGGVIDLHYQFTIATDLILSLTIAP